MYSQRDEESVILDYFKNQPHGRVLDIGAYDGKTFSNTLALIEKGWGGTLIEASPGPFEAMCRLHESRLDRLNLVLACLTPMADAGKVIPFYASNDAVATDDPKHYEQWKEHAHFFQTYMPATSIMQILEALPGPYDFINIDVEGRTTEDVFRSLPYDWASAKLVCVEHNAENAAEKKRWKEIGERMGMELIHTTGENHIFKVSH